MEIEWNQKLRDRKDYFLKTQLEAEERVRIQEAKLLEKYNELKKSEAENASKEIQRIREKAFKKAEDKLQKVIQEKDSELVAARMEIKIQEKKASELASTLQRIKELEEELECKQYGAPTLDIGTQQRTTT